ncbi:ACP phosphodiesterase [Labilibaculum sp.]|uniref:acyl carrier protein phosphodiesterase n=1 Tax=Labilibaculum sp. TaxID=2060723 RepID=UPI003563D6AE
MNFLAHQYLSGESEKIRIGNFIGDYIKGRNYEKYHPEIQKGILLHRNIDHFTDRHPMVIKSSKRLKKGYQKYSGVVVDVLYDHFLAKNWHLYHTQAIGTFVNKSHEILIRNYLLLPKKVKLFLPFMIQSRRMESYSKIEGIQAALAIMSRHTSLPDQTDFAISTLHNEYDAFEEEFTYFMKDLIDYVDKNHRINVVIPNDLHPTEER